MSLSDPAVLFFAGAVLFLLGQVPAEIRFSRRHSRGPR